MYWVVIETFQNCIKGVVKKDSVLSGQHFSLNCLINMTFQPLLSIFFLKSYYLLHRTLTNANITIEGNTINYYLNIT